MERETAIEAAVSIGAVVLFVITIVWIGATESAGASLSEFGALALVGSIVLFVLVMTGVGYFLAGRDT